MAPTNDDPGKTEHVGPKLPPALWRNRDYLLLWSGQTVSSIGSGVSQLAFPLLVLARLALIPDEFQGRVNSAFRLISYSLRPVGIALTGVLMQLIGIVPTAVVFAVILALLAVAASLNAHIRKALPPAQILAE